MSSLKQAFKLEIIDEYLKKEIEPIFDTILDCTYEFLTIHQNSTWFTQSSNQSKFADSAVSQFWMVDLMDVLTNVDVKLHEIQWLMTFLQTILRFPAWKKFDDFVKLGRSINNRPGTDQDRKFIFCVWGTKYLHPDFLNLYINTFLRLVMEREIYLYIKQEVYSQIKLRLQRPSFHIKEFTHLKDQLSFHIVMNKINGVSWNRRDDEFTKLGMETDGSTYKIFHEPSIGMYQTDIPGTFERKTIYSILYKHFIPYEIFFKNTDDDNVYFNVERLPPVFSFNDIHNNNDIVNGFEFVFNSTTYYYQLFSIWGVTNMYDNPTILNSMNKFSQSIVLTTNGWIVLKNDGTIHASISDDYRDTLININTTSSKKWDNTCAFYSLIFKHDKKIPKADPTLRVRSLKKIPFAKYLQKQITALLKVNQRLINTTTRNEIQNYKNRVNGVTNFIKSISVGN